ncbi:MAG: hypothetical protein CMN55_02585 [Sneathiella sp.]|jgi:hypothetical protein|uniref:hypothetical protein n=1 Tax=Sneathiella sp. TaxID=1964365 RepID=UPI000C590A0B|nr:hypothetical protein [Sneathiella sp.]MAL77993.1 hypothetical protein [Sneathiella sp.]|tara:strand:- start:890 stop:1297 length:408 start_codon:yes stop_codon:yes gene_type:complete
MKKFFYLAMVVTMALFVSGCFGRVQPVYNVDAGHVPMKLQEGSVDRIAMAIRTAAINRGWSIEEAGAGLFKATLHNRSHVAVVNIRYSKTTYSIEYVSSQDLLYENGNIHRSYNKWVRTLENDINKELNKASLTA